MISERSNPVPIYSQRRGITIPLTDQWHRIGLSAVLVLATILNFYGLDREGYGNTYYAAAVRSMMQNWHAFFFNSLDPAGFVTLDKPPLGFWLQVLSAKIFGFNGVALMLPQAVAGVLSVALLYLLVAKSFGRVAGLIAALALAIMPISVVANRNNIVDSTLVFAVLLGAWAVTRAVETGKLRWLLLSAVFVGLGFNIKMLEAYLVVPAFGLMYLVGAKTGVRRELGDDLVDLPLRRGLSVWRRMAHLVVAGAVLLIVSLSWVTAVDLTPASQRPWVGSTTTNSALDLAVGYNGLQRLTGNSSVGGRNRAGSVPGGTGAGATGTSGDTGIHVTAPSGGTSGPGGNGGGPGGVTENGPTGPLRLLNAELGPQVSWFLPLAIVGFFIAAWQTRRRRNLDLRQASVAMWSMWLLTCAVFFSVAGFYHTYYLVMIAPAIAALAGIGAVSLWRLYRQSDSLVWWLLPATLGVLAFVQIHVLGDFPTWSRWLDPLIVAGTVVAGLALVLARVLPRVSMRLALPLAALGALVLLAAPATWSVTSVQAANTGIIPRAGPAVAGNAFGAGGFRPGTGNFRVPGGNGAPGGASGPPPAGSFAPPPGGSGASQPPAGFGPPPGATGFGGPPGVAGGRGGGPRNESVNKKLLAYLEQHQGKATYLFGTPSAGTAEAYIIATGKAVMAMGGFTGSDPILTSSRLATLVKTGTLRYFLTGGFGGPGGGSNGTSSWIQAHCTAVPSSRYASSTSSMGDAGTLYDCGAAK